MSHHQPTTPNQPSPNPASSNPASQAPSSASQGPDAASARGPAKALDLSLTGVIGSSLAAITAAALGAQLGVAGTIIGAGLGSLITAIAAAVYTASLRSGQSSVRAVLARSSPRGSDPARQRRRVTGSRSVDLTIRIPRWRTVAVGAAAAFLVAIGVITAVEAVSGHTLSGTQDSTTVSQLVARPGPSTPAGPADHPSSPPGKPTEGAESPGSAASTTATPSEAAPSPTSTPPGPAAPTDPAPSPDQQAPATPSPSAPAGPPTDAGAPADAAPEPTVAPGP